DDPRNNAQNPNEWLGKMLRLDVNVSDSDPSGYRIPPDNPFLNGTPVTARPEIWSFRLRKPWRYTFHHPPPGGTGAPLIAHVGQNRWEEVDYEPRGRGGRNYGWSLREGTHDEVPSRHAAFLPLVDPIHEYDHGTGQSITGGYVYRGRALGSAYQGRYFFADYVAGRVWSVGLDVNGSSGEAHASGLVEHTSDLGGSQLGNVSSFGLDADAELYIVSHTRGTIIQVRGPLAAPPTPTAVKIVRP